MKLICCNHKPCNSWPARRLAFEAAILAVLLIVYGAAYVGNDE